MPHKDPESKRQWRAKYMREYNRRYYQEKQKDDPKYKARQLLKSKRRWEKVKADPELKAQDYARVKRSYQKHRAKRLRYHRGYALRKDFGITLADYEAMQEAQGGCCALCGQVPGGAMKSLAVDHCHKTGKVRGLLCHNCNVAIGHLRDDVELILKAADYIRRHQNS